MKKNLNLEKADIKAFLGPGSRFEGTLSFDEMVRLDGSFVGEINSSDTLVIGETARVEGNISVGALIISGTFKGNIQATTLVDLRAPARVEGQIYSPVLKMEDNVVFNGQIVMESPPGSDTVGNE
ncbi:MAG: hypothetical protein C0618_02945 [Desulfuromonas sp.]|nr:MAG: hypothetical protein C0618_02945 [Desulfuromonas sp.]